MEHCGFLIECKCTELRTHGTVWKHATRRQPSNLKITLASLTLKLAFQILMAFCFSFFTVAQCLTQAKTLWPSPAKNPKLPCDGETICPAMLGSGFTEDLRRGIQWPSSVRLCQIFPIFNVFLMRLANQQKRFLAVQWCDRSPSPFLFAKGGILTKALSSCEI